MTCLSQRHSSPTSGGRLSTDFRIQSAVRVGDAMQNH